MYKRVGRMLSQWFTLSLLPRLFICLSQEAQLFDSLARKSGSETLPKMISVVLPDIPAIPNIYRFTSMWYIDSIRNTEIQEFVVVAEKSTETINWLWFLLTR